MGGKAVEIITGRERRRRWGVADKLRILAECDEPGTQVSAVAARHGIYCSLAFQWRRQARDGLLVAERMPGFVAGTAGGRGRGRYVSRCARRADRSPPSRGGCASGEYGK